MAKPKKETRIKREEERLRKVFSSLEPNKLVTVNALIERAAFITISLEDLEIELNETGWTEEYINGRNQKGIKKAAAAEAYNSLTKNLTTIMKQLLDLVPPARERSKLEELMHQ